MPRAGAAMPSDADRAVAALFKALFTAPWYMDLLNINLNKEDLVGARRRIGQCMAAFGRNWTRITQNLDFAVARSTAV